MHNQLQQPLRVIQTALENLRVGQSEGATENLQQLLSIAIDNTEQLQSLLEQLPSGMVSSDISSADHSSIGDSSIGDSSTSDFSIGGNLSEKMQGSATKSLLQVQLEADLRLALERQEFFLCYQPIVLLTTEKLKGVEALVRWQHPTRGLIPPSEFIPLAEKTGLIIPLTQWVLWEACTQLKAWQEQFPSNPLLTVSVNISAEYFSQPTLLIDDVQAVLKETGLPPISLKLEITESAVIQQPATVAQVLQYLREMDIQTYLDDFGTGHSSLAYLCNFPVDTLKLDRAFITSIATKPENLGIVHSILHMAWNLGMNIVAEGIETKDQLGCLRGLKCDYGQGYFFSPPLNAQALEERWLHFNPDY